nr:zf-CCHC domain-containing protein/DUF4219 domain-containing protein/UBN2 domain-containing protein [Tanacetum cinerariifolium]
MKETPYEVLKDNQKRKLGKNNEAKMTLYNTLPCEEYKRVFMCKTTKELHKICRWTFNEGLVYGGYGAAQNINPSSIGASNDQ